VEGTAPSFGDFLEFLLRGGPAIVLLFGVERVYLLALLGARKGQVRFILPGLQEVSVKATDLTETLTGEWLRATHNRGKFLEGVGLTYKAQESLRQAFLGELLAPQEAAFAWMLHRPASSPLLEHFQGLRLWSPALLLAASALGSTLLSLLAWYTVGSDALTGRMDRGRLLAWSLVLLMTAPLAGLTTYAQGQLALRISLALKRIMLRGCINLPADEVKRKGLGHQLALIGESALLEQLAVGSAFALLISAANLASAGYLFWSTPGSRHIVALLALWVALCGGAAFSLHGHRLRWTGQRLGLTNDLIAKMSGHRTRRIQQPPSQWHEGEDERVADYWQASKGVDGSSVRLLALPRLWLVVGAIAAFPALLEPSGSTLLAVMIGLLLSFQAFQMLLASLQPIINMAIALRSLREPILAAQVVDERPATFLLPPTQRPQQTPLVELVDVVFRFRPQGPPLLRGCSLAIHPGERILLEGTSGSGKSTLTSLIGGLRAPESGLILVADHDHHTLNSEAWRRVVSIAPQFHENHIYSNTLGFNVLLGRRWPPSEQDLGEAQALCEELGLGPLLQRMPNGLAQLVGETGWQLSHGEKSRVFIARALLQRSEVLILDESFGALDPETLELCMAVVLRHSRTLIVIAHP
jgi:ATP-binding cassette subfamily B protein